MLPEGLELFFFLFYSLEMFIKVIAMGFIIGPSSYLKDGWNILDFIVVVASWIPVLLYILGLKNPGIDLDVLRTIRVLRPLKSIQSIKQFRQIMLAISKATRLLTDSLILQYLTYVLFAIINLFLLKGKFKQRCFEK